MASSTAAASSFSLLHSSSLSSTLLPSLRRLAFSGTTTFSGHDLSNSHFVNYFSANPITKVVAKLSSDELKGIRVFVRADLNVPPLNHNQNTTDHMRNLAHGPTVKHLINNGARVSSYFGMKNIKDMTYQLADAHSKYRQAPLSRVSGFPTVAVTLVSSRSFCSRLSSPINESQGPSPVDYCSVLQEDEFHKLADSTIHDLLEKLEEYGDSIDIDGFDIDYGNEVLTLKLGNLGTYVVNKQTPNRQIWLSSPVSGPSRFDWDPTNEAWVYRRNQANLFKLLESEIEKLCDQPLNLS